MINARSETVHQKPSFKRLLPSHRCLVPADGFFEWKPAGKHKQPYYIRVHGGQPFAFAGLWDQWHSPDGGEFQTFTLLTTDANAAMQPIHHRMPVILLGDHQSRWIRESALTEGDLLDLCAPLSDDPISLHPVSTRVNRATHDAPDCIEPLADARPPGPTIRSLEFNFDPPEPSA
jgi:putative SOS response-associated peptidase YedK